MYNKFYGVIANIKFIEDGNLINNQEKNQLLDKIKNTNFNWINIDSWVNHGLFNDDDGTLGKFIQDIKKTKAINLSMTIHINEDTPWIAQSKSFLLKYADMIIINLKTSPYLINKKEKQKILQHFFYVHDEKLILSDNFLDLDEEILKKYCQGILTNHVQTYKNHYGAIIFNGLNFFSPNKTWENLLFQNYNNIIHCTSFIGWQPLEILHSAMMLNDNQLKIGVIKNIQKIENHRVNQYQDVTNTINLQDLSWELDGLVQKTNDLLYDIQ
jgi:hypothetical protein